jgi:hypothetical protein
MARQSRDTHWSAALLLLAPIWTTMSYSRAITSPSVISFSTETMPESGELDRQAAKMSPTCLRAKNYLWERSLSLSIMNHFYRNRPVAHCQERLNLAL